MLLLSAMSFFNCRGEQFVELEKDHLLEDTQLSKEHIDSIASALGHFPDQTQFALAIIDDSTTSFYGFQRNEERLEKIENSQSVFEIGSITKVFTSTLLAKLVVNGELNIDDPVNNYLDLEINNDASFTFRQLANHTSGLPRIPPGLYWSAITNASNPYENYDEKKLEKYLTTKLELKKTPGTNHQYSNLGAGLLGYTLTKIKEQSYEQLLQDFIFQPLRMNHSTTDRSKIADKLVKGLKKNGKPASNWDLAALQGAGAILSTVEDLTRFVKANLNPPDSAFVLQQQKTFTVNDNMDIALGWHLLNRPSGRTFHWHNGGTGGYRSSMAIDLDQNKGVILLSNITASHKMAGKIDEMCIKLLEDE